MNQLIIFNKENESEKQCYSSMDINSKENKAKLFNATENADILAADVVGEKLTLVDVYLEKNPRVNEETGELGHKYRTILFSKEGKTYASGSYGLYNSVVKILSIYGIDFLHDEGLKVEIVKAKTKDGKQKLALKIA